MSKPNHCDLNAIEQEQMAAQIVSIMDAHFRRPGSTEKKWILTLAAQQITAQESPQLQEEACVQGR